MLPCSSLPLRPLQLAFALPPDARPRLMSPSRPLTESPSTWCSTASTSCPFTNYRAHARRMALQRVSASTSLTHPHTALAHAHDTSSFMTGPTVCTRSTPSRSSHRSPRISPHTLAHLLPIATRCGNVCSGGGYARLPRRVSSHSSARSPAVASAYHYIVICVLLIPYVLIIVSMSESVLYSTSVLYLYNCTYCLRT
ncbi:hypothetical protein FB45DRAFT_900842 [Roridomyces roridus]|uniref:Uncharacterized protein n=1 Tax=Roridomyces roridus TaxID=1738132 RepID=A0AAD7C8F8_9AGAR|nr:hypothetical protein FB45DRAFT_932682 [Roridomyces roridus]KAJ7641711.1 hypothetical protein FB45DRAFT_900842 [Roridomyces roridus]